MLVTKCTEADRRELLTPLVSLGLPVLWHAASSTSAFAIAYDGDRRRMIVEALGEPWSPEEARGWVARALAGVEWVHVAPLARSDFPSETLAELARGRRLSLDAQGLVRVPETGELQVNADYDPELLRHVWVLKVGDEEADVLGDPTALGVREVLLTHGSRGSTVYVGGRAEPVPAYAFEGDPTGAGDAFSIAYIASRSAGLAPAAAARRATAVVASVLAAA